MTDAAEQCDAHRVAVVRFHTQHGHLPQPRKTYLNEAAHLKISDIDSQRMQLRVDSGKGRKTRLVPMSPRLLHELREYWKQSPPPTDEGG